nr:type II toxin-antitoxin system HicA family toxin [Lamprobacter modestohalophilus]
MLALIGVISSLRYELAIPLPEDDGEAANVAVLSLILVGISALLSGVLVLLLGTAIADALGVPALAGYFWLLPVGVLLGGAYSVFNYWSVRTKRFGTIAGTKLSQALATVAIQLAGFKLGGIALLYAQVAGQSVGTTSLGGWALANPGFRQVSWSGIKKAAGRYRRFPIFLKHQRTLEKIFSRPVSANIRWTSIEELFVELGAQITEREGSRVLVRLFGERRVFHRPHPEPTTDKGAVESIRKWLNEHGVRP